MKVHGCSRYKTRKATAEYKCWTAIRERCNNQNRDGYAYYGGRGIKVCERWNDFNTFLADMGPKPTPQHSIDRIDSNGPYSPENCRWATREEQARNQRPRALSSTCRKGHTAFRTKSDGERYCTICRNEYQRVLYARKKLAYSTPGPPPQ